MENLPVCFPLAERQSTLFTSTHSQHGIQDENLPACCRICLICNSLKPMTWKASEFCNGQVILPCRYPQMVSCKMNSVLCSLLCLTLWPARPMEHSPTMFSPFKIILLIHVLVGCSYSNNTLYLPAIQRWSKSTGRLPQDPAFLFYPLSE